MAHYLIHPLPDAKTLKHLIPKYLTMWDILPRYSQQEKILKDLFGKYPHNNNEEEIMTKLLVLNEFYSTQIKYRYDIVKKIRHIQNIDQRLQSGDVAIVDEIKLEKYKPFSFATKYCSFQNPEKYPIYDSFVRDVLKEYQRGYHFIVDKDAILVSDVPNSYVNDYYPIISAFHKFSGLSNYTFKQLDCFLWQMGKEYFVDYKLAKVGLRYVIVSKSDQYSIYELYMRLTKNVLPTKVGNEYIAIATDRDFDFAKRMLSMHCNYVSRKDGLIRDYYLEIDDEETTILVYHKVCEEEKYLPKLIEVDKENDNIDKYGFQDVCKEIVEQYYENCRKTRGDNYKKRQNKKQSIIDTIKDVLKDIECSITFTPYCNCIGVYLNGDENLTICQVKNLFAEDMTFEYVDEGGKTINRKISSVEEIKKFTKQIIARAKKLCEAKEHNLSNEKQNN